METEPPGETGTPAETTPPPETGTPEQPQPPPATPDPVLLSDDFESGPGQLSACPAPDNVNSTWQWGAPAATRDIGSCAGGAGKCWGTGMTRAYASCEKSCIQSESLDLTGVPDAINVSLEVSYQFESTDGGTSYDGAVVAFRAASGDWIFVAPTDGSYATRIRLGADETTNCTSFYAYPSWPGWIQPATTQAPSGWQTKEFVIKRADHPELFHQKFVLAIFLLSDPLVHKSGIYVDNLQVRTGE